jgi:hypothetical protein
MLQLYREWRVKNKSTRKRRRKNSFHFRLSTKHALPALALFTTYSIPLTFTSPGEFCYVLHWMRGWLLFRCCFFFYFFSVFFLSFRPCLYVVGGLLFVCVSRQHTHTNTPHTPLDRKKNTCFYGFQSSLIQRSFFVLMLSPNLSRSKPIVKTLWPRQTLQSGYPFH